MGGGRHARAVLGVFTEHLAGRAEAQAHAILSYQYRISQTMLALMHGLSKERRNEPLGGAARLPAMTSRPPVRLIVASSEDYQSNGGN